jgi:hypothetical protein
MGPAFSVLLVLMIAVPILLIVLVIAKVFLPFWPALAMAVLTTASGAFGLALGLAVQVPFLPGTLSSTAQVLLYLGMAGVTGIASAVLAASIVWRLTRH